MAMKCPNCGGRCSEVSEGKFECDFCGEVIISHAAPKPAPAPAPVPVSAPTPAPTPAPAPVVNSGNPVDNGANLFEANVNGVLEIVCSSNGSHWAGSGYIISKDGYAITNAHVALTPTMEKCQNVSARVAGTSVKAEVIAVGTNNKSRFCSTDDLALIKLSKLPFGAKVLKFGDYSKVRTGQRIFIIGNSLGDGTCITNGIVSDRLRGGRMMHDCAQNGGNSGGPAFNAEGLVIGTNVGGRLDSKGARAEGMNYSIPSDATVAFIKKTGVNVQLL